MCVSRKTSKRIRSTRCLNPYLLKTEKTFVAYWPLTEPSCSSCVNRKTSTHGCKQIAWVNNQKSLDVRKLYIHGQLRQTDSHKVTATTMGVQRFQCTPGREAEEVLRGALNMAQPVQEDIGQYMWCIQYVSRLFCSGF